jgi:hypothetical protein
MRDLVQLMASAWDLLRLLHLDGNSCNVVLHASGLCNQDVLKVYISDALQFHIQFLDACLILSVFVRID